MVFLGFVFTDFIINKTSQESTVPTIDNVASLRWHYPDQVQRVFLTRLSRTNPINRTPGITPTSSDDGSITVNLQSAQVKSKTNPSRAQC
jgi:hypothetical protein